MALIQGGLDLANGELDDRGYTWSMRSRKDFVSGVDRKIGMYNDPTYLGFFLFFQPNSPLFNKSDAPGSARYYLNKVGEKTRAVTLDLLSSSLSDICTNMPWYWQSITGLENAWKWDDLKEPYRGGDDAKITIATLESIDLKIAQIIELYRRVAYDLEYRREILPENLRKFTLYIWVQEMRKFQIDKSLIATGSNVAGAMGVKGASSVSSALNKKARDTQSIVNEQSPWFLFQLDQCQFVTDDSNPFLGTLSFSEATPASNSVVIKYENIKYDFGPNLGTDLAARLNQNSDDENSLTDRIKNKIQEMASNSAVNAARQLENSAAGAVSNFVTSLYLGNAHDFSISGLTNTLQQASVSAITGSSGNQSNTTPTKINESVHGEQIQQNNKLSGTENVH